MNKATKNLIFVLTIVTLGNPLMAQTNNDMENTNGNQDLFIYYLKLADEYNDPAKWTDSTYKIIQEHSEFIDDLGRKGTLIFAGRTKLDPGDDNLFGIALIKSNSIEEAKVIMAKDPAVINNIQVSSIFPFSLGIQYFENLK